MLKHSLDACNTDNLSHSRTATESHSKTVNNDHKLIARCNLTLHSALISGFAGNSRGFFIIFSKVTSLLAPLKGVKPYSSSYIKMPKLHLQRFTCHVTGSQPKDSKTEL